MKKEERKYPEQITMLAKRIKQLRKDGGYTAYEFFAYEHKISRSLYYKFETGQDMRFSSIVRIAEAHGITLKEFFSEGFEPIDSVEN